MSTDRRDFLKLLASATATVTLGKPVAEAARLTGTLPDRKVDVAIIGAGLAGLTAAQVLKSGATVCVLEAGTGSEAGRSITRSAAATSSRGAVNGSARAKRACWRSPRNSGSDLSQLPGGQTRPVVLRSSVHPARRRSGLGRSQAGRAAPGDPGEDRPHRRPMDCRTCPGVGRRDSRYLAGEEHADEETKQTFDINLSTELGSTSKISLLYYFFIVRSAGSIRALEVDAQERRFRGGPQSLSKAMAGPLAEELVLDSPVLKIVNDESSGIVVESKRMKVQAKRVVVAMMPADTRRIAFSPAVAPGPTRAALRVAGGTPRSR